MAILYDIAVSRYVDTGLSDHTKLSCELIYPTNSRSSICLRMVTNASQAPNIAYLTDRFCLLPFAPLYLFLFL